MEHAQSDWDGYDNSALVALGRRTIKRLRGDAVVEVRSIRLPVQAFSSAVFASSQLASSWPMGQPLASQIS